MTYISNSMQSFMPIDLRASQFVRGNANFLAKNATRDIGLDKEVSFRKYNADVKELDALAGSMDKLAAQLETHLGELGEVEDKLNGIRDIINTVKEADDLHATDPLNNPALDQSVRDDYQRQINTFFSEIEDIVSTTKVFGKNVFDGYFNLGSIGDNKNESFGVNLSQGYISYDVTSIPTTEDLNMSLTLHDTTYGLSATLPQAISSISVSDQVNSFTGVLGDNVASGFDLLSMDTALKNFANMKQSYESQISRVKKRSEDILERRDKIASVQAFDEDNVSKILNTVYGSQPFDLSSIMQPFDKGIVSSLLP